MTEPTSGVPAATVSADVPADEPVGTPPVEPETVEAPEPVEPESEPEPEPAEPVAAAEPIAPEPVAPAEPVEPEPVEPEVPAEPVTPEEVPAAPVVPEPVPAPPVEPPTEPEPPAAPQPITPVPAAPEPVPAPPAEPVTPTEPVTSTVDAGLAAAAAGSTEVAPPHAVIPDEPEATVAPRPRRGVLIGATALGTLLVLALAAVGYTASSNARADERVADRRADAVNEARQLALNLVSLNYKTLDEDLKRISDSTTGEAREQFDERILSNDSYKKLVVENQAVITSKITRIGLEQCGTDDRACQRGDTAVVLVFLDQESKNKLRTTPRVDRNRVALTLVRRGDSWLVSQVEVL